MNDCLFWGFDKKWTLKDENKAYILNIYTTVNLWLYNIGLPASS